MDQSPDQPSDGSDSEPTNLLQDLDRRQNEVMQELDLLNDRINEVLTGWTRETHHSDSKNQAA